MATKGRHVVVVGAINVDETLEVHSLPGPGETVVGARFIQRLGGKGANQAVAAARAGAPARLVGAVGEDASGTWARALLAGEGVDIADVEVVDGLPTGRAIIAVDDSAENQILVGLGAAVALQTESIDRALDAAGPGDVLSLQLELDLDLALHAIARGAERGMFVVLNASPIPERTADLQGVRGVDLLIVNRHEAASLAPGGTAGTGSTAGTGGSGSTAGTADVTEVTDATVRLSEAWGCAVASTLGPDGVVVATRDRSVHIPAPTVTAVDTTGSGDTFAGYLVAGLAGGLALESSIERAVVAASIAATRPGTSTAIPFLDELEGTVPITAARSK